MEAQSYLHTYTHICVSMCVCVWTNLMNDGGGFTSFGWVAYSYVFFLFLYKSLKSNQYT